MSKIDYSLNVSEKIEEKISNLQKYQVHELFKKDELFEVSLCLAYMTLSKEKIIKKDDEVQDRLSRLEELVDTSEVEKVFNAGFAPLMPTFDESVTLEKDPVWRLDNIRDSIMHGKFDVDLDNKCFIIDNVMPSREMKATIPFSWFIEYAKNDILSKKLATKYNVSGLFYNKRNEKRLINPEEVIKNGIIYSVFIKSKDGSKFNAREVEDYIRYLFDECAQGEYYDRHIKEALQDKNKDLYDLKYLANYYAAKEYIQALLNNKYPNLEIRINKTERKTKIRNKLTNKFGAFRERYNILAYEANRLIAPKSTSILRYLTNIIDTINHNIYERYSDKNKMDAMSMLDDAINNLTPLRQTYRVNRSDLFEHDFNIYLSVLLSVYGINTLVINHEDDLYNKEFENMDPHNYVYSAKMKQPFINFVEKRTSIKKEIFKNEVALFKKKDQISKCPEERKAILQKDIDDLTLENTNLDNELMALSKSVGYSIEAPRNNDLLIEFNNVSWEILSKESIFYSTDDVEFKNRLRIVLGKLYQRLGEIETKYVYSTEYSMPQVLTIIRNALSHVGRINVDDWNHIHMYDYNTNNMKSGEVYTNFGNLGEIFKKPLMQKEKTMVL